MLELLAVSVSAFERSIGFILSYPNKILKISNTLTNTHNFYGFRNLAGWTLEVIMHSSTVPALSGFG
jgi:hypothetical protein